jgi:hypothetical protein
LKGRLPAKGGLQKVLSGSGDLKDTVTFEEMSYMARRTANAVIEDGEIKSIDRALPAGRLNVRLVYDVPDESPLGQEMARIIERTSGIYEDTDWKAESDHTGF